jgi:hypothetical protein
VKETANRGYPYPECTPPLVKDAADMPLQLKNLAEAIDDDVTALQAMANDAESPPAAGMNITINPVVVSANARIPYEAADIGNASYVSLATNTLVVPTAGLYVVTAYIDCAFTGTANQLIIRVNNQNVRVSSVNSTNGGKMNAVWIGVLAQFDRLTTSLDTSGHVSATINFAFFGFTRLVKI